MIYASGMHFYGGIKLVLSHFYEGINVVSPHFYEGINAVLLHFYGGIDVVSNPLAPKLFQKPAKFTFKFVFVDKIL